MDRYVVDGHPPFLTAAKDGRMRRRRRRRCPRPSSANSRSANPDKAASQSVASSSSSPLAKAESKAAKNKRWKEDLRRRRRRCRRRLSFYNAVPGDGSVLPGRMPQEGTSIDGNTTMYEMYTVWHFLSRDGLLFFLSKLMFTDGAASPLRIQFCWFWYSVIMNTTFPLL